MATVELIYFTDCPHKGEARAQLLRALTKCGLPPRWQEWNRDDPQAPDRVKGYGSPTVLVDGVDVAGSPPEGAVTCRIYFGPEGHMQGAPPAEMIAKALCRGESMTVSPNQSGGKFAWRSMLSAFPGIGLALLPKVACPACWPAYAGILGAIGLGFLMDTAYLLPLTAVFLLVALGALAFRARRRRGYKPFTLGLLASAVVLVGKFVLDFDPMMYAGIALLVGASLWNSWPKKKPTGVFCPACVVPGTKGR